ncbi:hypothetical protein Sjap_021562 [Stephania japonica]|uniref:DYW domain-containing protein n=1 Tax=Stephania japonica TaxID=461633 RepID=A0AAP0EPT5_9MAGN
MTLAIGNCSLRTERLLWREGCVLSCGLGDLDKPGCVPPSSSTILSRLVGQRVVTLDLLVLSSQPNNHLIIGRSNTRHLATRPVSSIVFHIFNEIEFAMTLGPKTIEIVTRLSILLNWWTSHSTRPCLLSLRGDLHLSQTNHKARTHALVYREEPVPLKVALCGNLVYCYAQINEITAARKAFLKTSTRGTKCSQSNIVAQYYGLERPARCLMKWAALGMFVLGQEVDAVSLVNVLPACASVGAWKGGKEVHGYALRSGLVEDVYVGNAVVDMYAKCGMMEEAKKVFDRMEVRDLVSWNAMVTGFSHSGKFDDALALFEKMWENEIELNVVTWSAVISGYAQRGLGFEAMGIFRKMMLSRSAPNVVTLVSLLSGCAAVGALIQGRETHGYAIKHIFNPPYGDSEEDIKVRNALIDMYAKCKSFDAANALFNLVLPEERDVVTWTVMIGGYSQHGDANESLKLFSRMLRGACIPNPFTISCCLVACARLSALRSGKQIHAYVIRNRFESAMLFVANCLIDMYSKCGDVDTARNVFNSMVQKNFISWTSLMTGYGMHGRGEEALQVFDRMQEAGFVPDGVTFVVVLYACSHSGMVDRGIKYFQSMQKEYGVIQGAEHYACMVDLLGRAGRLNEALDLIKGMPIEPSPIVWFTLLSACRTHGNVELGEYVTGRLLDLESQNDGSYTLLSNMYANAGRWKDVARVRSLMRITGIKKRPGCSWVQAKKGTASFFVGDRSNPQSLEIYELLANLIQRIKVLGYVPETSFALHDVDDEEKGDLLSEHSEKLALAYGILNSAPGTPIRITKNLRVCGDCHSAFTFISQIVDHEIILRDSSRFHHFKKGSCSCRGYW